MLARGCGLHACLTTTGPPARSSPLLVPVFLAETCNKRQMNRRKTNKFGNMYTSCLHGRYLGHRELCGVATLV
ncbi:hypothetical protein HJG60_017061 [Phyllostomus discolor]|uniref:Uncharacterized protein n=1 Tax=Phyllostomus discolor TaxID=89673 RepID=A0A834ETL8_9CHIR|nr:hypothetical protein HJG60_017061 [Phyllostomus discolor]